MLTITIVGTTPPCVKCKRAEREALAAAEQFPGKVQVVKIDALSAEAEAYGLIVTPATVLEDEVIASGRIVPARELIELLRKRLGG